MMDWCRIERCDEGMNRANDIQLRVAQTADFARMSKLLSENELPVCGIDKASQQFWLAEKKGELIGVLGLLKKGKSGLLRSLAVASTERNKGIAQALLEKALLHARQVGLEEVYLITGTAKNYFLRNGFKLISREALPKLLLEEAGMADACSACSDCLYCRLGD